MQKHITFIPQCGRTFQRFISRAVTRNFYDILEVKESATQNEIKAAYYRLSMKYHPDKNKESEAAAVLFHEITKAYDTLSNENLRSRYDDEVLGVSRRAQKVKDLRSGAAFYKSRQEKRQHAVHTGRSHIYNFDEFYKQHYGDAVQSYQDRKAKYQDVVTQQGSTGAGYGIIAIFYALITLGFVIDFFFGEGDPDKPTSTETRTSKEK